jgi:hypothetical protein
MNFQTRESYESLLDGEPYVFGNTSVPTKEIPVGSKLYRVDSSGKRKPIGDYPEWLGNYQFATNAYAKETIPLSDQVSTFTVKRPLRLVVWTHDTIQTLRKHPHANSKLLDHYLQIYNDTNESGYVTPLGYLEGNDEETARHKYINRQMADMICSMGFDGWIVLPNTLKWYIWGRVEEYTPEIVLCSPLYDRVEYSGGKRTYRVKRKNNKNRKHCKHRTHKRKY